MSRTERLFDLIEALRRHRQPIAAATLAQELGVSLRTIYRDVQTLVSLGAPIDGEAGVGYLLRPGFFLPPMNFAQDEIEALVLGARWVQRQDDRALSLAATNALAKIAAAAPRDLRDAIGEIGMWVSPSNAQRGAPTSMQQVRDAMRDERKLRIRYTGGDGQDSERTIWPLSLAFFDHARVVGAWCELRGDFRHFRLDRIAGLEVLPEPLPRRRGVLLKEMIAQLYQPHLRDDEH